MQTYFLKIYLILNFQPTDLYKTFLFALLQLLASRKIFRSEHILYVPARAGQFNHASSQETIQASCRTTAGDRKNLFEVGPNFSERDRNDARATLTRPRQQLRYAHS